MLGSKLKKAEEREKETEKQRAELLLLLLSCFSRVRFCVTPPGFPVLGILQATTLEWVAISFSNASK